MPEKFNGKVAVVTGGASGIGLECASALVAAGAIVYLMDRDRDALGQACDRLGEAAAPLAVDLFDPASVVAGFAQVVAERGRLDIFHANAGGYVGGKVWDGDPAQWDAMLNLNVNATFRSVRAALDVMMPRRSGDIIVTSSIAGAVPIVAEPIYTASKHAVQAFVHTVRRQVAPLGIRIGAVLPGPVHTPLLKDWEPERLTAEIAKGALMEASEVAECVLFMLSRSSGVVVRDLVILPQHFDV